MNYKKGDKVLIYLKPRKRYRNGVNSEMKSLNYKIAKITKVIDENTYNIDLDENLWAWNSEMFLSLDDVPFNLHSKVFGDITVNKISDDSTEKYLVEIILQDGDIINLTKDFRYFENSENNIF